MGVTPYADEITSISGPFAMYIGFGFKQFFMLGFIMMKARVDSKSGIPDAEPLVSKVWPVVLLFLVITSPSTNFYKMGNLTYPFYPKAETRCLYIAGAVMVLFIID